MMCLVSQSLDKDGQSGRGHGDRRHLGSSASIYIQSNTTLDRPIDNNDVSFAGQCDKVHVITSIYV